MRESAQGWRELLVDFKARGVAVAPELATGDGATWLLEGARRGVADNPASIAEKYRAKHQKAVTCLVKDRDALLTFYDFPTGHWDHLRTPNPIESVFATVRHRTARTKGALSQDTTRLTVFKLVTAAAKTWRRLKGERQLPKVVQGIMSRTDVEVTDMPARSAT